MRETQNYKLFIADGTDLVNLLTQANPNYEKIDIALKNNADSGVTIASESKTGTTHNIVRSNKDCPMFRFVATSDFVAGETFALDGNQVTVHTTSGTDLSTNAFRIGSSIIGAVSGSVVTLFVQASQTIAEDSEKLGGELPAYYAKQTDLETTNTLAVNAGTVAQNVQSQLNERQNITMSLDGDTLNITF